MKKKQSLHQSIYIITISSMALLIIGILTLSFFNAQSTTEHRSESDGLLNVSQLQYNCDEIIKQAWRITNLAYINNHAQSFMSNNSDENSRDNFTALSSLCSSYHYTHPMIYEIGFYSAESQRTYAVNNGLSSPYYNDCTENDTVYSKLFDFIDSADANKSVFYCEKRNSYTPYLLTLIRTTPSKSGATFLSIDLSMLLNNAPSDKHTEFYVISSDGTLLCSTQNKGVGNPVTQLPQISKNWDPIQTTQYHTIDGQEYLYSTAISELLDIYYLAIQIPSSTIFLGTQTPFITFSVLLTIAISVLLITMIPKKISVSLSPINKLLGNEQGVNDRKNSMNLTHVTEQIVSLLGHNADLQSSVGSKIEELRQLNTKALQYQINPHFIYNTLNLVNTIAVRDFGNDHDIAAIMRKLSKILRYSLDTSSDLVPLAKELEHTQCYIDIMQKCYPNLFNIKQQIPNYLLDCEVPRLSFQPLIENAIYHGIHPKGSGTITLSVNQLENKLTVCIYDTGIGMTPEQISSLKLDLQYSNIQSTHIGLANIHRRIQLLFGESYGLSVNSEKNHGTCVTETLPYTKSYPEYTDTLTTLDS